MRELIYSMSVSVDGFTAGPDGDNGRAGRDGRRP
jgi:hypothetical protein